MTNAIRSPELATSFGLSSSSRLSSPEDVLAALTTMPRPPTIGLANWEGMTNAERLAFNAPNEGQTARANIVGNRIHVIPDGKLRSDLPTITLPNNVGAEGFSPGLFTHDYLVAVLAPPVLRGPAGLAAVERALIADPTPGRDAPASPRGTRNDVGDIVLSNAPNFVRSYVIRSSDPRRSDVVVNYTTPGHFLSEGFVMRFAELRRDGRVELVTYGEGNSLKQIEAFSERWGPVARDAWLGNSRAVFRSALGRQ